MSVPTETVGTRGNIRERWFMKIKLYYSLLLAVYILSGCAADKELLYSPDMEYFYKTRGDSYYAEGNYELAISDYNKVIKLDPKRNDIYFIRAEIYKQQKEYDLALADYNKALDFNPSPLYYWGRGSVYYMKKQYDSAIKEYIKAIRLNNNFAVAYNSLAWLLATCSDEKYRDGSKAVELAKKAVEWAKRAGHHLALESQMLNTLAAAYAEAGDFDMAVKSQEKAIQLFKEEDRSEHRDRYGKFIPLFKEQGRSDNLNEYEKRLESYKRDIPLTDM